MRYSKINNESCFSCRINNVLLTIDTNFNTGISIQRLSTISNISKSHLERIFKKEVGLPIKKYIILRRLYEAACILRSSLIVSTTCVCFDTGFNDFSNFIRQFRRHFGCSPVKFRNCNHDPRKCKLRKNAYIYSLGNKKTPICSALDTDISTLCYLNRVKKANN
jgi:AraC-like DNA-binding protein